jgi:GNAT superfamily N-acetyltransferase
MDKTNLEMTEPYLFERISPSQLPDLQVLFRASFGIDMSLSSIQKKFSTESFGASYIGYLAYTPDRQPSAYYGVYPCLISYNGQKYLAAQSGDTMTHPAHQGKGLFTQLARKTYELCKMEGIQLVYGFPNQNSYPGFINKLAWTHFDDLEAFEIRVRTLPWVRLKNTFRLPQAMHDSWCRLLFTFLKKGRAFSAQEREKGMAVVCHTEGFEKYKSYSKSQLKSIGKSSTWLTHDDMFLLIGDVSCTTETEFIHVISRLKRMAFFCGLPHLRCHVSTGTKLHQWLSKHGNRMESSYPVGGINFTENVPLKLLKFTTLDNDTF